MVRWSDGRFYRGLILDTLAAGDVLVRRMDYGDVQLVVEDDLFEMPLRAELHQEPLALHCRLHGWQRGSPSKITADRMMEALSSADQLEAAFFPILPAPVTPDQPVFEVEIRLIRDLLGSLRNVGVSPVSFSSASNTDLTDLGGEANFSQQQVKHDEENEDDLPMVNGHAEEEPCDNLAVVRDWPENKPIHKREVQVLHPRASSSVTCSSSVASADRPANIRNASEERREEPSSSSEAALQQVEAPADITQEPSEDEGEPKSNAQPKDMKPAPPPKLDDSADGARKRAISAWNPMQEEFDADENGYGGGVEGFGLDVVEERNQRLCRFFRSTGHCYKGITCEFKHIFTGHGDLVDGVPVNVLSVAHHELRLPQEGQVVEVYVTSVSHPGSFFCMARHGIKDIAPAEADQRRSRWLDEAEDEEEEGDTVEALLRDMSAFYGAKGRRATHGKRGIFSGELAAARDPDKPSRWLR